MTRQRSCGRYAAIHAAIEAINAGRTFRSISKPWEPEELLANLRQACAEFRQFTVREHLLYDLRSHLLEGHA